MAEADSSDNDEKVSQFMAFTGCADPSRATSYLEMSGGNVETAVGLFMEHEAGSGHGGIGGSAPGGVAAAAGPDRMSEDVVRAPDETRTMRLMDDNPFGGGGPLHQAHADYALMRDMMDEQLTSAFGAPPGGDMRAAMNAAAAAAAAGASSDDDDFQEAKMNMDDEDDSGDGVGGGGAPPARLSNMFAAPTHIMHRAGGFQGARTVAKDSKRWLLVNIQKDSEFASHALNRDVWRDELVENLVREGFIFWQAVCESTYS